MIVNHSRSSLVDFTLYLQSIWAITPTSRNRVYDQHYELFGFDLINSIDDYTQFLCLLDSEAAYHGLSECKKAQVIRRAMQKAERAVQTYRISEEKLFKVLAGRARRVPCHCHEDGSYYPLDAIDIESVMTDISRHSQRKGLEEK